MSSKPQEQQNNKPEAQAAQLSGLEEDDEFEEFAAQDWNEAEEDKDSHQWDDNWDDDDIEDDFSQQLRAELQKSNAGRA
ncbi:MAG: DSS1/SEM1 family-domain-containing protein [Benniella sp.]|nr:MAG: DSS1/SEM1 family-domain-containing protein [Benniella sp.]